MSTLRIKRGGKEISVAFDGAGLLTQVLREHGMMIATPCGGKGVCGKCRVRAEGALSAPTARERACLSPEEIAGGTRLACQTVLQGDAVVSVPDASDFMNIQLEGTLPEFPHHPMKGRYGLAADIGTTTLALRLVDLKRRALLKAAAAVNPQNGVAADVIGRIEAALNGEGKMLQALVTREIENTLQSLCADCGISSGEIGPAVMAGNTTMLYLLTGRDPTTLSRAPFAADCLFHLRTDGGALGMRSVAGVNICLPACVGAFVGADIVCGVLASGMCKRKDTAMLVDLGTNGEIALWHGGTLYCCATAAGPAFEGANIRHGAGSVPGAIDSVWVQGGRLAYTTMGGRKPVGICGSGLIDATAAMLKLGLVDETGLMEADEVFISDDIGLTQKDIRSIQLAKGAIAAGIKTICGHVGISAGQIETLYIAGGFGSHISVLNAVAIGLIPRELTGRAAVLGNASLTGAEMMLLNESYVESAAKLAHSAVSVPLGGSAAFAEHYMNSMMFD
ncbi:MAG: DUF4445 domain-containing protein [Clostridiales bacterium]|nr:DUF4445 domain-containing protein [Clostridiales bacterium]